jgi:hypothetical protein
MIHGELDLCEESIHIRCVSNSISTNTYHFYFFICVELMDSRTQNLTYFTFLNVQFTSLLSPPQSRSYSSPTSSPTSLSFPSSSSTPFLNPTNAPSSTSLRLTLLLLAFLLTIPGNMRGSPSSVTLLVVRVRPSTSSSCCEPLTYWEVEGLMVMLDERRGRVCSSDVGECGGSVALAVAVDGFWRASCTGPRGPERVLGGRVEKDAWLWLSDWVCCDA